MSLLVVFGGPKEELHTLLTLLSEENARGEKVKLLLVHQACRLASDKTPDQLLKDLNVETYAVEEDIKEQDLSQHLAEEVRVIDYDGWVKLLEESRKVVSWV